MSKLSKFDIQMAISAIQSNIGKVFFCKNVYHDVVAHVPSFELSTRSFSFFSAFFLTFYGKPFYDSPYISFFSHYFMVLFDFFSHMIQLDTSCSNSSYL